MTQKNVGPGEGKMAKLGRLAALLLLGTLTASVSVVTGAYAVDTCSSFSLGELAVDSPASSGRLLTSDPEEAQSAARFGYTDRRGVVFKAAAGPQAGLVPVWRMWNKGRSAFTWAAEGTDLALAQSRGYAKQFVQFYASPKPSSCLTPVYRMRKGSQLRVVAEGDDRRKHAAQGWSAEGISFYAAPVSDQGGDNTGDEFSIAVIPDTQEETYRTTDDRLKNRSNWILTHLSTENIKHVAHVGDIIDWGAEGADQFKRAAAALKPVADRVSTSLVAGNHDTAAVCTGGSACPGVNSNIAVRDTSLYNRYMSSVYKPAQSRRFEAGKIDNSYTTFSASKTEWLVLNLELWPRPEAVEWAKGVVANHPHHNVIVVTHSYLDWEGNVSSSTGGYGATSPRYLWTNLIKVYPNIKMVLSGHLGASITREDTGVNGNRIISLQQCFHDGTRNPVRMIRIDEKTESIKHRVYSPVNKETMVPETGWIKVGFVH